VRWPLRRKPAHRPDRNRTGQQSGGIVHGGPVVGGNSPDCGPFPFPRPDPARIALLEYTELGIRPTPGTAAAAVVGMHLLGQRIRQAAAMPVDQAACPHQDIVETTEVGQARETGLCTRCGAHAVQGDDGAWTFG
jgi:hypothetical protein